MIDENTYESDIKFTLVSINGVNIGKDRNGLTVKLYAKISQEFTEYECETVDHQKTHAHNELSISVWVGGDSANAYGGQAVEVLDDLRYSSLTPSEVQQLRDIWERWHLNNLKAGCIHQGDVDTHSKDWEKLSEVETSKCPEGYRYGSAWLVEPLPYSVVKFIKHLAHKLN